MQVSPFRAFIAAFAALAFAVVPDAGRAADPYEIAVVLPLTGPGAFVGKTHQTTLGLFEAAINRDGGIKGQPIKFAFYDDQTSPQVAVQLANQILAKKPAVVLGSSLSAMCRSMMPLFQNGPVHMCLSPAVYPAKDAYTFSNSVSSKNLLIATLRYFRERGWTRIARITTTDASGQDGATAIAEALALPENSGLKLVDSEQFAPTDVSVAAQVATMKAAAPQAIIAWISGTPFGTALHAIHDAGIDVPVVSSTANMIDAQLKQYSSFMVKQLYFPGLNYAVGIAPTPQVRAAQRIYTDSLKAAGVTTDLQSGFVWDPALIVIEALRHVGTSATAAQLHDYIEGLHDFAGITGVYDFRSGDQRGVGVNDVAMMRWDGERSAFGAAPKAR